MYGFLKKIDGIPLQHKRKLHDGTTLFAKWVQFDIEFEDFIQILKDV